MKKILILLFLIIEFMIISYISYVDGESIIVGLKKILISPTVLITDFLVLGGIGASFLNAILILIFNLILLRIFDIKINGIVIAAIFTIFGFSFFGKNILNILPFYIGGILYSKYQQIEFREILIPISFSSALAPFVSDIAFNVGKNSEFAYINGIILGVIIGFIIVPISKKLYTFHEGYNLYNLGFVGGVLGTVIVSLLKVYQYKTLSQRLISAKYSTVLYSLLIIFFIFIFLYGYLLNEKKIDKIKTILFDTGYRVDYIEKYGYGLTFMNMGITGIVTLMYPYLLNQTLNGPILAGILTVVGFSAVGKNIRNILPILIGVYIAYLGSNNDIFTVVLSGLFGTSLAPIAGVYGIFWGITSGILHFAVVQSIGILHGGLNLYNNGFSAGIVAGLLVPIIECLKGGLVTRKSNYNKRRKNIYIKLKEESIKDKKSVDKK